MEVVDNILQLGLDKKYSRTPVTGLKRSIKRNLKILLRMLIVKDGELSEGQGRVTTAAQDRVRQINTDLEPSNRGKSISGMQKDSGIHTTNEQFRSVLFNKHLLIGCYV